jgi:hypothetical protein
MSRDENMLLRTYRNGGPEERMDVYLAHPGLRGRFDEIERKEETGSVIPGAVGRETGMQYYGRRQPHDDDAENPVHGGAAHLWLQAINSLRHGKLRACCSSASNRRRVVAD